MGRSETRRGGLRLPADRIDRPSVKPLSRFVLSANCQKIVLEPDELCTNTAVDLESDVSRYLVIAWTSTSQSPISCLARTNWQTHRPDKMLGEQSMSHRRSGRPDVLVFGPVSGFLDFKLSSEKGDQNGMLCPSILLIRIRRQP